MFTAEQIEECDIFPKKITATLVFKLIIYILLMMIASILLYSFYSGRDFTSIITMESLKYGTDTYFLQKIFKMVFFSEIGWKI